MNKHENKTRKRAVYPGSTLFQTKQERDIDTLSFEERVYIGAICEKELMKDIILLSHSANFAPP